MNILQTCNIRITMGTSISSRQSFECDRSFRFFTTTFTRVFRTFINNITYRDFNCFTHFSECQVNYNTDRNIRICRTVFCQLNIKRISTSQIRFATLCIRRLLNSYFQFNKITFYRSCLDRSIQAVLAFRNLKIIFLTKRTLIEYLGGTISIINYY